MSLAFLRSSAAALLWLLLLLAAGGEARAQQARAIGTRFLVAFPDTTIAHIGGFQNPMREDAEMIFFSSDTAHVTITAPGYRRDLVVTPDSASTLWLLDPFAPSQHPFIDTINRRTPHVFDVRSDKPISLTCYFATRSGGEAFVPLPVESWGTEYFAMSLRVSPFQHVGFRGDKEEVPIDDVAPAEIVVIASEDSTDVNVKATTGLATEGVDVVNEITIRLDAGEAVLFETARPWFNDPNIPDLSGTHITATRPVGVITGNSRTQGGVGSNTVPTATGNSGNNTAVEWLAPIEAQGSTFVFRPIAPTAPEQTEELVRVYATSPGLTTISTSTGSSPKTIPQGSFVTYSYAQLPSLVASGSIPTPFAIRTDKPAQAMVISGSYDRTLEPTVVGEQTIETWSPAMSLLPPREEWFNSARFHTPLYPPYLQHYLVATVDSGAQLWVDGVHVTLDPAPVPDAPFQHVRMQVAPGDHTIRCIKGRCGAIAYGIGRGVESYLPQRTRKRDDDRQAASGGKDAPEPLHPSIYSELISLAYAYPVTGVAEETLPPDSLTIARDERCDSTVVSVERIGPGWTFVPYDIAIDPASFNTDVEVTPVWGGSMAGYTIRFKPVDPSADAEGKVILTNAAGLRWEIPYSYRAHALAAIPDPINLLDVTAGVERTIGLRLVNQKPFSTGAISIALKSGGAGFSLRDLSDVGKTIRPGDTIGITLAFTGSVRNADYVDTIVVVTPCGSFEIPVHARTGPSPVPVITGKDWGRRLVGGAYDSLSTIANIGSLPFTIREVAIAPNPSNAFELIAPDWRSLPAVGPGESYTTGIRFRPPAEGTFVGTILLITTDNDTASAELRGIGVMPAIEGDDLLLGELCLRAPRDTTAAIRNNGSAPLRVSSLALTTAPEADVTIDTIAPFLPRTLAPNEELRVPIRITPRAVGTFAATITVGSDALRGDSTIAIGGTILACTKPKLVIDDHDFDSVLITLTRQGFVTLRNLGGGDATVTAMALVNDTASAFTLISPSAPFTVKDSDSVRIFCSFTPRSVGLKTAEIALETDAGPLTSHLRGVGRVIVVPALIRRDYHAQPGEETTIRVELKGRLDTLPVRRLDIAVGYSPQLLDFLAATPDSGARHGWRGFGAPDFDTVRYAIDVNGAPPDTGTLLSIRFLTRFNQLEHSELPFTIEAGLPYLEIVESPGLFTRDPFCGLEQRLFVFAAYNFRLDQNIPNPLTGAGRIEFEIPFDNQTTLIVYDALGTEMARLVEAQLAAGAYTAYIQPGMLPAGLYYYRLRSGEFTAIRKMIVEQ